MTTQQISTSPADATTQFTLVTVPDLAANIAEAQAAADLAYQLLELAGCSAAECADAYHYEYAGTMRLLGTPAPCSCDHCRIFWKGGELTC